MLWDISIRGHYVRGRREGVWGRWEDCGEKGLWAGVGGGRDYFEGGGLSDQLLREGSQLAANGCAGHKDEESEYLLDAAMCEQSEACCLCATELRPRHDRVLSCEPHMALLVTLSPLATPRHSSLSPRALQNRHLSLLLLSTRPGRNACVLHLPTTLHPPLHHHHAWA